MFKAILSFLDPDVNKERLGNLGAPGYEDYATAPPSPTAPNSQGDMMPPVPTGGGFGMRDQTAAGPANGLDFNLGTPVSPNNGGATDSAQRAEARPNPAQPNRTQYLPQNVSTGNQMYDPRVAQSIIDQYVNAGYDPRFAAGMAANAMIESAGNPTAYNKSEGAFGLFQHRLDRLDNMRSFANRLGMDINDISTQISFSIHEFTAGERAAYAQIMGGGAESASDYARLIDQYWERSDGSARNKRAALAEQIYGDFFGQGGTYNGREVLSFGEDIDPLGIADNRDRMNSFNIDDFMNTMSMGEKIEDPMANFFLGAPDSKTPPEPPVSLSTGTVPPMPVDTGEAGSVPVTRANPAAGTAPVSAGADSDSSLQGPIQRFLDHIYNTSDLSDEERIIRRRGLAQGFAESLGYLTLRGNPNMEGVYNRVGQARAELSAREQEEARGQALAQMATKMGLGDIAGLAYMGSSAQNSLANAMVSSISSKGTGADYDLDAATRESIVAQLPENHPARAIISNPNMVGKPLEDAVQETLKYEAPTSGDNAPLPSAAGFAQFAKDKYPDAPQSVLDAISNAGTAAELNTAFEQLGGATSTPADVLKYEYMQALPEDERSAFQEMMRAGAGGDSPESLFDLAVTEPVRQEITRFSEGLTDSRNLADSARIQQMQLANPENTPNSLQAATEPLVRLLTPIVGDGFFDGVFNDKELLANRTLEAVRNSNLGNLASGVPGQLSNLEGEKLLSIMAGAGDRRIEGLALTQFIQRNHEKMVAVQAARQNYLRNLGNIQEFDQTSYEAALKKGADSVPVFRTLTPEQYRAELGDLEKKGVTNENMDLMQKSEVIMLFDPKTGKVSYETFGFYPEDF